MSFFARKSKKMPVQHLKLMGEKLLSNLKECGRDVDYASTINMEVAARLPFKGSIRWIENLRLGAAA